ncbi:flagellar protein FlaG [Paenibacillus odorifer]|uniref:Flagellar biosynthesis protein FlaG n=1 Tax=Paenibacillus odorifer TaxID=189426 RepID=A0A1R0Y2A9_9BACL|nr:flagellar protein FlaG [Paenibacillus odorifer]OMD41436.1 flagellar biosynthesis protein FlaG [Paenibacillus odorifer]
MDVRLSNSGSYTKKIMDTGGTSSATPINEHKEETVKLGQLRSNVELKKLESQGFSVSTGEEQVIKALDRALKALQGPTTTFEVSVHKQTKAIMVKVLNKETGELIREIPPEKTLDLVANMMEIVGIMIDERI